MAKQTTPNYQWPLLENTSPVDIVTDYNRLANAVDSQLMTVSDNADEAGLTASNAQTTAKQAKTAADNAAKVAGEVDGKATQAQTMAQEANTAAQAAQAATAKLRKGLTYGDLASFGFVYQESDHSGEPQP